MLAGYLAVLTTLAAGVLVAVGMVFGATWAALLAIAVLLWLFARYVLTTRRARTEHQGAWINRKRHPGLWQMVDEVAEVAHTRVPDEIRLGPDMRADVREQGGFRSLTVGLPMLGGLSASELRAVTGHRLAHFRASSSVESRLPRAVVLPYRLITRSQSRAREEQAEAVAISATDEETAKAALLKLPALAVVWRDFRHSAARVPYHSRTPDLVQRFNTFLTTPEGTEALAKAGVTEWVDHGGPAWELLAEPDKTLPYLQRQLFEELGPERAQETT